VNDATGAKARFQFNGSHVSWTTTKGPDRGKAEVWIDGTRRASLDLFAPNLTRTVAFVNNGLTSGTHTLEIRVLGTKRTASNGTKVDVDVFSTLRLVQ